MIQIIALFVGAFIFMEVGAFFAVPKEKRKLFFILRMMLIIPLLVVGLMITFTGPSVEELEEQSRLRIQKQVEFADKLLEIVQSNNPKTKSVIPQIETMLDEVIEAQFPDERKKWKDLRSRLEWNTELTSSSIALEMVEVKPEDQIYMGELNDLEYKDSDLWKIPGFLTERTWHQKMVISAHGPYQLDPYHIARYETTEGVYRQVMNLEHADSDSSMPVTNVSWIEAVIFCIKLSIITGENYSLPSELQWEYAARANSIDLYSFGSDIDVLKEYGFYKANSDDQAHPVGQLKPNKWGLHDVHGNVAEWTLDWEGIASQYDTTHNPVRKYSKEDSKVMRGGDYSNLPGWTSTFVRSSRNLSMGSSRVGFRLVRNSPLRSTDAESY